MSASAKLYCITTDDCSLPLHVTPSGVSHYPAHDIPQVLWPDGTVCWLVNLYLLSGYRKGRSRKNKGGTLLTWAKNLSHLVRWCYQNKVDFIDLTDSHFRMFVNALLVEKDEELVAERKRGDQQVSNICSTVLNFLAFVDSRMPGLNLIGPDGRVRAEKKSIQVKGSRGGQTVTRTVWVHEHVPRHGRTRRRQPISTSAVNRLYEANATVAASAFVARRRYIMLRLLEITGGRRIEVSLVRVLDLEEAERTGELKVYTAKQRRDDVFRYVPVTQADLRDILSFVKHYRHRVMRSTIGTAKDHGFLFIAETNGQPLEIDTLGAELYVLRKAAGIDDEEACMHAFRHRYITNIFRDLIRTHHFESPSDLRRALLSTETLKAKVMEWTGHSSLEALDHYIHMAFEAESNFQETLDLLQAKRVVQSLQLLLRDYSAQFRAPKPTSAAFISLAEVVEAAASELGELLKAPE
ncbi:MULTISPECIES: tyrosine-type recombinase/integrase [Paraburkholderia]|uniref:tyrosine-type recombinase/integrase n=1 Tax=Paraburkholderia TaxID=1822464 RepID=UPI00224F7E30|nr:MULTISPECIES: site-specific integrase [Paraburkholderia]MCX4170311.1 site-specific integrase [Paraburkholderia madseniana]MDQ6458323.1 site-specific integrase [Paraburkholderia madseniana]